MTSIARNKANYTAAQTSDIRPTLTNHRTSVIDGVVLDKVTDEVLGIYTCSEYAPEPFDYPAPSGEESVELVVNEDGSPITIFCCQHKR